MNPPVIDSLGQVALTVRDVTAARHFYTVVLGLPLLFDAGPNLSFVSLGNVRLMITTSQGAGEPGKNSALYFRTGSVAELYAAVVGRGAKPEREPALVAKLPDHELWMAFVRDPEGNLVGLMEERR